MPRFSKLLILKRHSSTSPSNLHRKLIHIFNQSCLVLAGECGVIDMALLGVIRRWYFRDGMSKREIARRTGLSRNTLKKYLSQSQVEPVYSPRQTSSKLDDFVAILRDALIFEAKKPRKQRKTVKQLYHDLLPQGYCGSYDRVAAFARHWRQEQSVRNKSMSLCYLRLVRPSSLTGARTGCRLPVKKSKCRSRTLSSVTARQAISGRTGRKPTKCCLMRTIMPSGCLAACQRVAFTTI
jgi:transcriptional regulator with XRE-family HTH domain